MTALLAPANGEPLNVALIARLLGVSHPTAALRIRDLQRLGLVRLLPFFGPGKKPILYLRGRYGAGLADFRAFCIEAIITRLGEIFPESRFSWWKTGRVRQIDLVAEAGEERIGFCFAAAQATRNSAWLPLAMGCKRGLIHRGYLLHSGKRAFIIGRAVHALPLSEFLAEPGEWILRRRTESESRAARNRINALALQAARLDSPGRGA